MSKPKIGKDVQAPAQLTTTTEDAAKSNNDSKISGKISNSNATPQAPAEKFILGRYKLCTGKEDFMGKGTSSVCRRGVDTENGKQVAIKLYREQSAGGKIKDTTMQKYKRQIAVLKELQEPWVIPEDKTLWNDHLRKVSPCQLFMQLLDYSKTENGEPGPDKRDGMLYVVTELAQYSLKEFLADRREKQKPLSRESIRDLSKRVILATCGLHAKGFVHIDMKPENLMVFDGRLKVIDVDGCVRAQSAVSIDDGSISFSPCYCAPEWARFMIKGVDNTIEAQTALDVWSVGMTLCEFVTFDAIWKPQFAGCMRNAMSQREAGFLFLEWLGDFKKLPLPNVLLKSDPDFQDLLINWLLVIDPTKRKSCAEAIENPFLNEGGWDRFIGKNICQNEVETPKIKRERIEDGSNLRTSLHKGRLWKLNSTSDPKNSNNWIQRDMWIAENRSLCYYSVKEGKRLVLVDCKGLSGAQITTVNDVAKDFAFHIVPKLVEGEQREVLVFAAESAEEKQIWETCLQRVGRMDLDMTMKLGSEFKEEVKTFNLAVRNRRMKLETGEKGQFDPVFKAKLWKLKTGGDRTKEEDWFERQFSIAKNGSFVYWSQRDGQELIYYTASDLARASPVVVFPDGTAARNNAFTIQLAPNGGVEFDPGEFSAESKEMLDTWIAELRKIIGGSGS